MACLKCMAKLRAQFVQFSSQSRMQPRDWSQRHVVTTTSPRFLQHSTGFQCARELCSRLWCWCGSVITALLPATSPNSAFLLFLLQVVSISGQPRRAYYKFPGPESWSAGAASLSRYHLCGTVFLQLYRDQRWLCTLSRDNWRPIYSTSDVLANRMNVCHRCCGVSVILRPDTKQHTYLLTCIYN